MHIIQDILRPEPEKRDIVPFTEDEIKALLAALSHSRIYNRPGKRSSNHSLPGAERNRAIIMMLLDTGIRANELATLRIHQVDTRNQRIHVFGKVLKNAQFLFHHAQGRFFGDIWLPGKMPQLGIICL